MRAQKSGRIISIASGIAHHGTKGGAHYAASKAGIIGFVKALARELAPDHITVNAICPGLTDTTMPRGHRTEEELQRRLRSNPLGRVLQPEDQVGPVLFLASDAASYITGQVLNVNCGSFMF
jgi:NAD(P)-dependent dehydrogenase (short-subunit alcohol dehydrogenase family)